METKIIDIEEYRLKKLEDDYREAIMAYGKLRKMSKNTSGRIDDLVNEIEKDEISLFKESKRLNELYIRGEYVLEEDF